VINDIISYVEMCRREGQSLQRGMNFSLAGLYAVILMSVRPNAPYRDRFENGGSILIYEGHDLARSATVPDPKGFDQPEKSLFGKLTENGKFFQAAAAFKRGECDARRVRVYEKIKEGIWSYNGLFRLVDAWKESDGRRMVFKFKLEAELESDEMMPYAQAALEERRRVIPSHIKVEVWKRDKGQCVICGLRDELHFDHVVPYSKGGTSARAENVQLLCARHNLSKSDKIL
jgi:hypothetical protein